MSQKASIAAMLHDLDQMSPAGFAVGLHLQFTRPTYLFQTYPRRWMDHYSAEGLVVHDPTVHWGLSNLGHVRWADLESIDRKGVLERAKDFGIMNGVTIAMLLHGTRSIASFARADREYEETEMTELEARLVELHRATMGLTQLSAQDRRALTALSIRLTHY